MDEISPSSLKTIMYSKRANIYYLEYCRLLVNGGRVEYVTDAGKKRLYWNVPIANTTTLLLGPGTSITQAAVRELGKAGVMIGFSAGGGTPLFAGTSGVADFYWVSAQSEYRPTEYVQAWMSFWFDDSRRLKAAKAFQIMRSEKIAMTWRSPRFQKNGFKPDFEALDCLLRESQSAIQGAPDTQALLTEEARITKALFRMAASAVSYGKFTRSRNGDASDPANRFLDHGNYLAYGLGATSLWVLGIPHGFAVLHGKTRRGGLVFDVADLVKDAMVMPQAFISAMRGDDQTAFRAACTDVLVGGNALDFMIDVIKDVSMDMKVKHQVP
ncbi:CRISPR-associated protein [Acetobacter pasteurianus NBRC 3280]|uniref:CRISPR-associated protein n=1 Tax=Acetobacter pasteurianus NBRC 3278 TaxID=1226660 RepID=A0A401X7S2_ACEPA|nr:type I-F CRISPR-associated endonuclease Cas1f [Acetobacter pasteurianus]GCD60220.1 CRISPR-associated protein [Acetobacter pasteurianus NBRC 3277]GCD63793.1 CRISPR-associated protein [Acetobacter pasteurianus NBRC 3278]GCD70213.1 CRISPR-associated protein [Acetobacter pasteurianus NBRC 3280]